MKILNNILLKFLIAKELFQIWINNQIDYNKFH
jgi:hypothetical protein